MFYLINSRIASYMFQTSWDGHPKDWESCNAPKTPIWNAAQQVYW